MKILNHSDPGPIFDKWEDGGKRSVKGIKNWLKWEIRLNQSRGPKRWFWLVVWKLRGGKSGEIKY